MYTRVTTFKANDIAAIEAKLSGISGQASAIPGVVRMQAVWSKDGNGMVLATYENKDLALAGQAHAAKIWEGLASHLAGLPETIEFDSCEIMT